VDVSAVTWPLVSARTCAAVARDMVRVRQIWSLVSTRGQALVKRRKLPIASASGWRVEGGQLAAVRRAAAGGQRAQLFSRERGEAGAVMLASGRASARRSDPWSARRADRS
jgi:hypothetical protein